MISKRATPRRSRPELFYRLPKDPIFYYSDGREKCNLRTAQGLAIYKARVEEMRLRQGKVCCNCKWPLAQEEATFEHENTRNARYRDDRTEVNGVRINGASHGMCNVLRGSRRTPIWKGSL